MLKVITIVGTRPEIIRLSVIIQLFDKIFNHKLVHTGQNYDYELNEIFFNDLEIRKPDYFLNINTQSLGKVLGETLSKTEEVLQKDKPDAVLILGDTNSSIACIIAKRMRIPIYHMEAGNRCFDLNTPEEINRRIIDHVADFNLVYTEHARTNLLREGLPTRRIYLTGSPLFEVIQYYWHKIEKSHILKQLHLKKKEYFVVSAHREENVENDENIHKIVNLLKKIYEYYNTKIIFTTHPRTRKNLDKLFNKNLPKYVEFVTPLSYTDYIYLQKHSKCVISDSGTISEESSILSFPAVTIRNSMERPEAMDAGNIIITGLEPENIMDAIALEINDCEEKRKSKFPSEYFIEDTSRRVAKLITGTAGLSNKWDNINLNQN